MNEVLDEAATTVSRTRAALRLLHAAPRPLASWLLLVAGALLLFAAQFALWASEAVVDSDGFTERAVRALADEDVQRFVSNFLVEELIEEGDPGLIAARPLIEAAVQAVIGTAAFEQLYETALLETHRALFSDEPIVLQLVDAAIAVEVTLAGFDPELAEALPPLDSAVIELADSEYVDTALDVAHGIRILSAVLPLLALAAFAASWAVARGRRRAVLRIGLAVASVAAATIAVVDIGGAALQELSGGGLRGAAAVGPGMPTSWSSSPGASRLARARWCSPPPPARGSPVSTPVRRRGARGGSRPPRRRTPGGSCGRSPRSCWAGWRSSARTTS